MSKSDEGVISSAFHAFATSEMPWLLDAPDNDAERLTRLVAKTAFERGYQARKQERYLARSTVTKPITRKTQILDLLREHGALTAEQIDSKLGRKCGSALWALQKEGRVVGIDLPNPDSQKHARAIKRHYQQPDQN